MASGLLDKANIILTPTGYKAGTMYNVAPIEQPYEDFDFARASVASRVNSSGLVEMVGRTLGSNLVQNGDFSELGSELVTNGDFATDSDWTKQTGWSIANGVAIANNVPNGQRLQQGLGSSVVGKTYKYSFNISNVSGAYTVYVFGVYPLLSVNTEGLVEGYVTATSTNGAFFISGATASGLTSATIDNVSIKEVDPNDYWNLGAGWSLGDDEAIATNTTADSLYQDALTLGKTYKVSFEITEITSGSIRLGIGINFSQYFTTAGTYTYYGEPTFDGLLRINPTSSTNAKITNVTAQEIIDTNNIPRINYDSNGENGHWLLEPTSTNLIPYSEDFTTWTVNAATTVYPNTAETLSPSGEYNASKITSDGSNGLYKAVAFGGGDNTKSIYLKGIVGGEQVILRDPAQTINQKTLTLTTDWVRYELSENQTSTIGLWINEIPSNGIYMWGGQLEALPYATSYIPTLTGSTETRATETATGAGSADLINSTEGVLYAEIAALADDGTYRFISLNGGGYSNSIRIGYFTTSNTVEYRVVDSNAKQVEITHAISDTTDTIKIAAKYKANDFALWINGVEVATDTSGTVPSNLYELDFNDGNASNNSPFYGKVKALTVYNTALTDAELIELTS